MTPPVDVHFQHTIRPLQLFSLALGPILGAGWIIAVGQWIAEAGQLGTVVGFLGGALVLSLIAACYAQLGAIYPETGGEVVYAGKLLGSTAAYYTGWCLAITYIGVCAFSAISVGWVVDALVPGSEGPLIYSLLGQQIHATGFCVGVLSIVAVAVINFRGIRTTTAVQDALIGTMIISC